MNTALLSDEIQEYIRKNTGSDLSRILFSRQEFHGITQQELVQQIEARKRCEKKLPLWFDTPGIYFPPKLAIEQSSSALTAEYKSRLLSGVTLLDLTAGFGADSFYFSKIAEKVVSCEVNTELSAISHHNAVLLGAGNIAFNAVNGVEFLAESSHCYDTIYIDPSRRAGSEKVFRLQDCTPDVPAILSLLRERSNRILLKTSPLLDIQSGLNDLAGVNEIHIISVKNDCKELLWIIDKEARPGVQLICTALDGSGEKQFRFEREEERQSPAPALSSPLRYLYEPDTALLKAGAFKLIAVQYGLEKLHQHTHLYTAMERVENFAGKIFAVRQCLSYRDFLKHQPVKKANIVSKNFPLTVDALKKKHRLQDGGNDYLFFTRTVDDELIVILADRLTI